MCNFDTYFLVQIFNNALGIFYPYGVEEDEMSPQSDDGSSPLIPLLQPFVYFGRVYDKIFVRCIVIFMAFIKGDLLCSFLQDVK